MGVLEAFMATWSKARAAFGEGPPQDGSVVDASAALWQMQSEVEHAQPGDDWRGPGSDAYAVANEKQTRVLGESANLDRRLRAEVQRSATVVAAGRRDLDEVRQWVTCAASAVPLTPQGDRMLYPVVSRGSGEIVEILQRSHVELNAIAGRIRQIGGDYQGLSGGFKLGTGDGQESADGPQHALGDGDEPWTYPFDPPPPPDSAPGGGRWELGQGYPPGPGGGPPMGPMSSPQPWHRKVEPPIPGGTSGLQEVSPPPPNGWGVQPAWTMQEAYRFRVTGEGFGGEPAHQRWIQREGTWHQATWVSYDFEAEHVRAMVPHNDAGGYPTLPWGSNRWSPVDIQDIYGIQVDNPRLPLYVPNPFGGQLSIPVPSTDRPVIVSGGR
ncbi:hypothetical protein NGTWS1803_13230 [Mycolicibacterium cyprinidarum]|nr:hypothetical protein NGTWS1803_13230 [Mycolicibacterium sp. NGTWS1803]